jgi:formiminoglutamase
VEADGDRERDVAASDDPHLANGELLNMSKDPQWSTARDWLDGPAGPFPDPMVGFLGVPLHIASLTPGRCDLAPGVVRETLRRISVYDFEHDRDLRALAAHDFGDVRVAEQRPDTAFESIVGAAGAAIESTKSVVVVLGGDNSVTRPAFHALWRRTPRTALLTFDAHLDIRSLDFGFNNGNPISALLADGLPGSSIIQIGIQPFANSQEYSTIARAAGIRSVSVSEVRRHGIETVVHQALDELSERADQIYIDADIDILDRPLVPGAPGSRPGGLSMHELRLALLICGSYSKVRMIDFVEFDPSKDVAGITAYSMALAVLSFVSGLEARDKA